MPSAETTQTQSTAPWQPAQGALTGLISQAQNIRPQDFMPVMGSTTREGLQGLADVAREGSQATPYLQSVVGGATQGFGNGLGQLSATAGGANLNGNPHLNSVLNRAAQQTANDVNQQFAASGRYGSANHAGTIADRVGALRNQAEMQNYNTERGYQMDASGQLYTGGFQGANLAPQIDAANLLMPGVLQGVGETYDQYEEDRRLANVRAAQAQAGLINPIANQGQTMTGTTSTDNPMGTAIGGLTTGLGLLSAPVSGTGTLGGIFGSLFG